MLADTLLVATNKFYFSKSTGRTKANVLTEKVIFPNNIWGTPGTLQHDTNFYGVTKELSLMFWESNFFFSGIRTGESDTANETKYAFI